MKKFRTLCASTVLILYALLAGASIDSNGDFEGWFIALCIIVPIVIILVIIVYKANLDTEKDNARKNIPNTYTLEYEGDHSEFYYDSDNQKILAIAYDASSHKILEIPNVIKRKSFNYVNWYFMVDDSNEQLIIVHTEAATITHRILLFKEICGIEISENGYSIFRKSTSSVVGRALVGGILLGDTGAIIGGTTARSEETKMFDSYKIIIQLSNIDAPIYEIEFFDLAFVRDGAIEEAQNRVKICANQLKSILLSVIKSNELTSDIQKTQAQTIMQAEMQQKVLENKEIAALEEKKNTSIADELLKLSELHKNGVLTDEEYEALKKKLL